LADRFGAVLAARQAELGALAREQGKSTRAAFIRQARKVFAGLFGKKL
jgi:hypothetical protein